MRDAMKTTNTPRHRNPSSLIPHPFLALLLIASATVAAAAPRTFAITNDGRSWVGFRLDDTIEDIDGDTKKISGAITADPENLATASVTLTADTASLDTGMKMRDDDMRDEYLEVKKYPAITFKSTGVSGATSLAAGQAADLKVAGDFTLHGVTRRIIVPVHVTLDAANRLHATSKFTIRMTDYNITVPSKIVLSVANEVTVKFDVFAVAR
jgi:polyisoprenoid-binding protein YceI